MVLKATVSLLFVERFFEAFFFSGLDIAYVKNGYLYHTEFDKASFIPAGSLQRAGENVLATLKTLAHSPCLARPCPSSDDKIIFFDVLGLFVVQYSMKIGVFLNFLTAFFVFAKVYGQFRSAARSKNEFKDKQSSNVDGYTVGDFVRQLITHVLSLICIIVSAIFLTKIVDFIDLTLSWYSQPLLMLPLYMIPLVFVGYTVHLLVPKFISCLTVSSYKTFVGLSFLKSHFLKSPTLILQVAFKVNDHQKNASLDLQVQILLLQKNTAKYLL